MKFHEQFLDLYVTHYRQHHALSASAVAALCAIAKGPHKSVSPRFLSELMGTTYLNAWKLLQRLTLEGYVTSANQLTEKGRLAVGLDQAWVRPSNVTNTP